MSKVGQDIFSLIDQRIDSYIKESKITCRSIAQVQEVLDNNKYKVTLMGYDTVYTFPSRPYVDAIVGDYVFVESKMGAIDNGIIIDKINGSYGYVYNKNGSSDEELNKQGAMLKSTYDRDNDGIVDNAERVNNHYVYSDVPYNAVFTDTTVATSLTMSNGNTIEATISSMNQGTSALQQQTQQLGQQIEANYQLIDDGYYYTR